jgi:hypothetical protein
MLNATVWQGACQVGFGEGGGRWRLGCWPLRMPMTPIQMCKAEISGNGVGVGWINGSGHFLIIFDPLLARGRHNVFERTPGTTRTLLRGNLPFTRCVCGSSRVCAAGQASGPKILRDFWYKWEGVANLLTKIPVGPLARAVGGIKRYNSQLTAVCRFPKGYVLKGSNLKVSRESAVILSQRLSQKRP